MTIRIGLIGCGIMGADHAAILHRDVAGASLAAVYDADTARAEVLAAKMPGTQVAASAEALIADAGIDAVLIAAPDALHAPLTLACIAAGKPVLCEKPLADSVQACRAIVDAEVAAGRMLVQVGFMRRFDAGYRGLRDGLRSGRMGAALFLHCVHRNKIAPEYITSPLVLANSMVHEMDIARYVLDEDYAAVTVIPARASRHSTSRQPQFMVLETRSGVVVNVEMTPDAQYGYEVQGELVCEDGTLSLAPAPPVAMRHAGVSGYLVEEDWRPRFVGAYRTQAQEWVAALRAGTNPVGASAWDGYVASATAAAALASLAARQRTEVVLPPRPSLYG